MKTLQIGASKGVLTESVRQNLKKDWFSKSISRIREEDNPSKELNEFLNFKHL